ncbi:MAG TPA: amino acid carrier protein [Candidatus Babeliales bacterium]|nr:amino acid carrier protein [Candidatus Babeliales bacterium]
MNFIEFFKWFDDLIALPAVIIFLGTGLLLTFKLRFLQFHGIARLITIIKNGLPAASQKDANHITHMISPFQALCTAMGTTIGMGNLMGPPLAVFIGGPGALFWLMVYIFFSSATKFTEVVFALHTRIKSASGEIIGGPMRYLEVVHPYLAHWYACIMLFVFISWSSVQSNTIAQVYAQEGMPIWLTGFIITSLAYLVLIGGSERVGETASKLVPFMFFFYVIFALVFLFQDIPALKNALILICKSAFTPSAAVGGAVGASIYQAMRMGFYKGIFITEAGMGTSSIPHAVANVQYATDQGLLAMFSMVSDALLSMLSGMLVLVNGVWMQGEFRSTLLYEVFVLKSPLLGKYVFLITITLFVFTTLIGNSYNGRQVFGALTNFRYVNSYLIISMILIFCATLVQPKIVWGFMEFLLPFVAIPNLIGLLILAYRYPHVLQVHK